MTVANRFDQLIDQYRIEKQLGEKTYTNAFLGYDVDGNFPVTLEVLRPEYAEDLVFSEEFHKRTLALTQIRHPNIVQVHKVGITSENHLYYATEYIEGYPLTERIKQLARQKAPAHSIYALKLIRQITSALVLTERLNIFHYELTPDHVLLKHVTLKSDDTVVLVDMGIPVVELNQEDEASSEFKTKFLSPEQLDGKSIDGRSHVYSLGAMLFSLLTAETAVPEPITFTRETVRTATAGKTQLEQLRSNLAPETYKLINTTLQQNPGRRYRSLELFLAALDNALAAEETYIHTAEVSTDRRRPWPFFLAPLLILILCFGAGFVALRSLPRAAAGTENTGDMNIPAVSGRNVYEDMNLPPTPTLSPPTAAPTETAEPAGSTEGGEEIAVIVPFTETAESTPTQTYTATPTATETAEPTATITATPWPYFNITISSANLRTGPGIVYAIVGYVFEGDTVRILARNNSQNSWYNVETEDGTLGWISEAVGEPETDESMTNIPIAATIPPPPPTNTPTPTRTPPPTSTPIPSDNGGGNSGGGNPAPSRPTPTPPLSSQN